MANEELLNFIRQRLASNTSHEELVKELRIQGYSDQEIADAFAAIGDTSPVSVPVTSEVSRPATVSPIPTQASVVSVSTSDVSDAVVEAGALPSFSILFKRAWAILKARPRTIFGIAMIIVVPQSLPAIDSMLSGNGNNLLFSYGLIIGGLLILSYIILYIVTYFWGTVALLYAITDSEARIGIKESFMRARGNIVSLFLVTALAGIIAIGGFLLLIVPGIIFAVWYSLSVIIFVTEGLRGMDALRQSKRYVRGHVTQVFGLMFLFGLLYIPFYAVLALAAAIAPHFGIIGTSLAQIVTLALSVIYTPLVFAFQFVLYKSLKARVGMKAVRRWRDVIVVGIVMLLMALAIIGVIASVILASFANAQSLGRDARRESDVVSVNAAINLYSSEHNAYPDSLDQLVPQDIPEVPVDPSTDSPYEYQVSSDGKSYEICATLENAPDSSESDSDPGVFSNGQYCMMGSMSGASAASSMIPTAGQ